MLRYFTTFLLILFTISNNPVHADSIIMKITFADSSSSQRAEIPISETLFNSLPQHEIVTETPWTDGKPVFRGPLLTDLLNLANIKDKNIRAIASNNYSIEIPKEDYKSYGLIVARSVNGKPLTLRTKGPLWIIYPWDQNSELKKKKYYNRSIWQVTNIEIR